MIISFIFISIIPAMEYGVYDTLSKVKEISELYALFGKYDIMAKIEAKDSDELAQIILNKIRTVKGITDTKTLMGVKF